MELVRTRLRGWPVLFAADKSSNQITGSPADDIYMARQSMYDICITIV